MRCVAMLKAGLLQETAELLAPQNAQPQTSLDHSDTHHKRRALQADSPAGRAIGYRQTMDYLLRPNPAAKDVEVRQCCSEEIR